MSATATPTAHLETLPSRWRGSFDAANSALAAAGRYSGGFSAGEIARRSHDLAVERDAVSRLLDAVAHEEHIRFRRPLSAPRATTRALGLPAGTRACLFDLDGVLTGSAPVHAAAWRDTLDRLIRERAEETGHRFEARYFDLARDYYGLIHGKPRLAGIHAFLDSRAIHLPEGQPSDAPGVRTVHGLANRKQAIFRRHLDREPMAVLEGAAAYLETAREADLACAVISASANTRAILERGGLGHLIQACVDGQCVEHEGLEWKPAPDAVLFACRLLHMSPDEVVVFDTLPDGVAAARTARAGYVVGVDRHGSQTLRDAGADLVVPDLGDLLDPAYRV
jgi:beta-phosphoglucomutase-like phosphatase (HAD superfamily)